MTVVIGAVLDDPHATRVRDTRAAIAEEFGGDPVATPTVHVTLQSFATADADGVVSALEPVARERPPFSIRTNSLGTFPRDAAYVTVVRDDTLSTVHERVQSAVEPHGEPYRDYGDGENPYGPDFWVPHVSLAVGRENVGEILDFCRDGEDDFLWDATIGELVVFELDDGFEEIDRIRLGDD